MRNRRSGGLVVMSGGAAPDTEAPSVTAFTATTPTSELNIPITAFTASEAGVQFLITESSTPPEVDAAGWAESAPTAYTVTEYADYTLYPWVKDEAGNVSAEYGSPVAVSVTWSVLVESFTQSLGSELVTNGNMETGDPPTGWAATNGTPSSEAEERTGGAGTKSCRLTASAASARITNGTITVSLGDFLEITGWIKAVSGKQTELELWDGAFIEYPPAGTAYTTNAWKQEYLGIRRAGNIYPTVRGYVINGTSGDYSLFDDVSIKKITLNSQVAMPAADAQIEIDVTLPETPTTGQGVYLYYRMDGTASASCWRIELVRNRANTAWALYVWTVDGNTETSTLSVADVGTPDGLKVVCIGNEHRFYTHATGTWSQQGAAVTDNAYNNDKTGCNVVTITGTTVTALRGSRPVPFDFGLTGDRYYFIHGDSKSTTGKWDWRYKVFAEPVTANNWHMAANIAVGGLAVQAAAAGIDAALAGVAATPVPELAMINLGANDIGESLPPEALWKAAYLDICDAIQTKWPDIKIYLMRVWKQGYNENSATINGWINDAVIAERAFVYAGPDESIFLENGDNGVTYTADGTHPNEAGYQLTAQQWVAVTTE